LEPVLAHKQLEGMRGEGEPRRHRKLTVSGGMKEFAQGGILAAHPREVPETEFLKPED
jgi:hypothetical protein